jgi:hypothetical protein
MRPLSAKAGGQKRKHSSKSKAHDFEVALLLSAPLQLASWRRRATVSRDW